MMNYRITSDSTVDLGRERMEELGVPYVRLVYIREGVEKLDGMTDQCALEIYDNMRNGVVYKSAQANPDDFTAFGRPCSKLNKTSSTSAFPRGFQAP